MPADDVLRLPGRSVDDAVKMPKISGMDGHGHWVTWYYEDCEVVMHRRKKMYRVKEVKRHDG